MMLELCKSLDILNDWLEAMVMAVQHSKLAKDGGYCGVRSFVFVVGTSDE